MRPRLLVERRDIKGLADIFEEFAKTGNRSRAISRLEGLRGSLKRSGEGVLSSKLKIARRLF